MINYKELPEKIRDELYMLLRFRNKSSDIILSTLMRISRDIDGKHTPQEVFDITKEYLIENKFKLSENIKEFEKTVNWEKMESD